MEQAIAHFTEHDVVAAPVNTIPQAAEDPHPWERRAMVEVPDFLAGEIAVSGDYWHFSRTPVNVGSDAAGGGAQRGSAVGDTGLQRGGHRGDPAEPGHLRGTLLRRDSGVGLFLPDDRVSSMTRDFTFAPTLSLKGEGVLR